MTRISDFVILFKFNKCWLLGFLIFLSVGTDNRQVNASLNAYLDTCIFSLRNNAPACHQSSNATFCIINTQCSRFRATRDDMEDNCSLLLLPTAKQMEKDLKEQTERERPTPFEVWTYGGIAVGIISLSGVSGALLWPLLQSQFYKHVMRLLIGLAVGSLTSTAVFQLIPEGFQLKDMDPDQNYLKTALYAWFSIWALFSTEALTKIIFNSPEKKKGKNKEKTNKNGIKIVPANDIAVKEQEINSLITAEIHATSGPPNKIKREQGQVSNVAWIIIFGDGLHNLIDGMSIGAGFTQSLATGFSISLAIACEEFPHELGDFAILVQSGLSLKKALLFNFLSACTAFIGLALGIILGELEGAHYIFAFAGGLFLYVSLTHLIPELQEMLDEGLQKGRFTGVCIFILQNVGILTGFTILYFITKYNDYIQITMSGL